jgi:hypothetical protein
LKNEKPETPKNARKRTKKEDVPKENSKVNGIAEAAAPSQEEDRGVKFWLMKAEPESRIVKGKVEDWLTRLTFRM